ncbi:MAG: transcription-repair coupling factor, partial [Clostridia bacterium]|nr:transcription-repair coupling factor [Clostridia bacterium]
DARSGGEFAVRGGIFDVYPVNAELPCRIDFFDDEIDSIAQFSTETQRRVNQIGEVTILPAAEALPRYAEGGIEGCVERIRALEERLKRRKKLTDALRETLDGDAEALRESGTFASIDRIYPEIYEEFTSAFDHMPSDAVVILDDPGRIAESMKNADWRRGEEAVSLMESGLISEEQTAWMLDQASFLKEIAGRDAVMLDTFTAGRYEPAPRAATSLLAKELSGLSGGFDVASEEIGTYLAAGYGVLFCAGNAHRATVAVDAFRDAGIEAAYVPSESADPEKGRLVVTDVALSSGAEYPGLKTAILTESARVRTSSRRAKKSARKEGGEAIRSFADLHPGDLIVHDAYGIGRFVGIMPIETDGLQKDYIKIQYFGSDVLYVPVTQLDLIAKYVGAGDDGAVRLNRMGGGDWVRAKSRAKAAAKELAGKLIALYAARAKLRGYAFPKDSEWQKEFEESFEYEETEDQLRTTLEIKRDMESEVPMDRLLCGDVGFGKTEVAFRAVMKCVMGGKQAAILVPTTVLARQHYQTALHRFRGYPLRIGMLSRFTPPAKAAEYMRQMRSGMLDLVVGTHKLLGKNVAFRDLGLLVVDEEQRFGVSHKERLKELARTVDVLTLTATPIPRTLNMALSGIRDMSLLEEAPHNRYPVQTYVLEHDEGVLRDAIAKELARGGQVYYLHNRVETITRTASKLQQAFPEAQIAVGHGQMKPEELSDVMRAVTEGEVQILVCTTIIETGVDIPNVNTLIVEDADRMGLAQLHQIRGRVGRSNRRAYAYLTYHRGKVLSEVATKRLSAIREFAEFGAGFHIAMRDLEIRGAGNVLGAEQSGHMISVGYDMYLRLLDEAVVEARGEEPVKKTDCTVDLEINARISEKYIPNAPERLDIYRRIAYIRTPEDAEDMTDELLDRYGEYGAEVGNLIRIALLRNRASEAGITEISEKKGMLTFRMANPDFMKISVLCVTPSFKGRVFLNAGSAPYVSVRAKSGEDPLTLADQVVAELLKEEK